MKHLALTVYPYWGWAIIDGRKRIENRNWNTSYRGKIWIHTSRNFPPIPSVHKHLFEDAPDDFESGKIIGSVDLVDVVELNAVDRSDEAWAFGPLCFVLRNPRRLRRPLRASGNTRLWTLPQGLTKQARYIHSQQ
jgi:hypothetical protein|tara:strand:+ start:261 stop:665 length:405 start_codon:yes stop_codon:yes gene_type:complete